MKEESHGAELNRAEPESEPSTSLVLRWNFLNGGAKLHVPTVSKGVISSSAEEIPKTFVNIGDCSGLAPLDATGQNAGIHLRRDHGGQDGGSGGARTRNLCRDRAAL